MKSFNSWRHLSDRASTRDQVRLDGARLYLAARNAEEAGDSPKTSAFAAAVPALSGTFDASDFASHDQLSATRDRTRRPRRRRGVLRHARRRGQGADRSASALATIHQNFTGAVSLITIAAQKLEAQGRASSGDRLGRRRSRRARTTCTAPPRVRSIFSCRGCARAWRRATFT